ncbi:hypothetical protein O3G_MSEX005503 [Manduca sexta]|uniref:Uncharacterized protein n=1 Tax=Manduca sexta TaxID=7130 RepID=A0A921YYV5_MANSE|nr:hypothetical protein O3G_MSEX005503 [Manduca sexta]
MSFANKVVLVTGSSSGIGAVIALTFAKEGAKVAIVGRNVEKLAKVAGSFDNNPPLILQADLTDDAQVANLVQKTIDHFGKLDVLVNNAGVAPLGSILQGNLLEMFDQTISINLRAVLHLTTLAAPHLIKTKGSIVNISGVWGMGTPKIPSAAPAAISKAGLNHFTKIAALELAPYGVRVNAISPGPVRTDIIEGSEYSWEFFEAMTALKKLSCKDEIADLILFLASDKGRSITGSNYVIDNGMLLL